MKRLSVQFVMPLLVIAVLLINQGLVVCSCQAGHVNVQPVLHSGCLNDHSHIHDRHEAKGHFKSKNSPINSDLHSKSVSSCECNNCVDLPLDSSDMLAREPF